MWLAGISRKDAKDQFLWNLKTSVTGHQIVGREGEEERDQKDPY